MGQPPAIGAFVVYRGRTHVVRGYSRLSRDVQYADLEDALTADRVTVPVAEIVSGPLPPPPERPSGTVVPFRRDR